jgi:hypothetical protein
MVVVASRLNVADSKFRSQILHRLSQEGIESSTASKDIQRMKQLSVPLVTPVPKFLFSEQKAKLLPRASVYAMFSLESHKPVAAGN